MLKEARDALSQSPGAVERVEIGSELLGSAKIIRGSATGAN